MFVGLVSNAYVPILVCHGTMGWKCLKLVFNYIISRNIKNRNR